MNPELIITGDGSHSLYRSDLNETYHSRKGALTESDYVYIQKGLACISEPEIRILEFGFGTGLNALLAYEYGRINRKKIHYLSAEKYPLEEAVYTRLNYAMPEQQDVWLLLHQSTWNTWHNLSPDFRLFKFEGNFTQCPVEEQSCQVVFYDAFAPSKQADAWTEEQLSFACRALGPEGLLVTYCAQGAFKRQLKALGMEVEVLPGPPGKMEMVRARKI